jgi:heterogeneous nuclear ribonucleoprotein A1/A3
MDYFSRYGEVAEVQIMQDHMTGRSRGFGFVTFEDDAAAERVFSSGVMHHLGGKQVEVKPATPKGSGSQAGGRGGAARLPPRGGEYGGGGGGAGPGAMPYGAMPGAGPYGSPYGIYPGAYAPGRGGMVPYGLQYGMQYPVAGMPPYMMMPQQGMGGMQGIGAYALPATGYPQFQGQGPAGYGGGGGGGTPASPIPFTRQPPPGPGQRPSQHSPSSPYQPRSGSR